MSDESTPPGKTYAIRCPRLGHQIDFSYCRVESHGTPCFKILDCWHAHFDVVSFLEKELDPEALRALLEKKPKPKMCSLLEMIAQAKQAKTEKEG